MKSFIFENSTKVIFGKGCVKKYLASLVSGFGDTVMVACGSKVLIAYFSFPEDVDTSGVDAVPGVMADFIREGKITRGGCLKRMVISCAGPMRSVP